MNKTVKFEDVLERDGVLFYTTKGVSMRPLIRAGKDAITIKKALNPYKRLDVVLFKRRNGQYVLHRILKDNGDGTFYIVGDNCIGGETVREEQILGVAVEFNRDGTLFNTYNTNYKIYSHLWCDLYYIRCACIFVKIVCQVLFGKIKGLFKHEAEV